MAAKTEPNLSLSYGWEYRESGWKTGMDANLLKLGTIVQCSVINQTTTSPPGSPSDGDRYIIGTGATGAWAGKDKQIAVYILAAAAWSYYVPAEGWLAWDETVNATFVYDGSSWGALAIGGGTYTHPLRIGRWRLWDGVTNDDLRAKLNADPSSDTDGVAVAFGEIV